MHNSTELITSNSPYNDILILLFIFFFFNDTATTEIYTLSLHDALPIYRHHRHGNDLQGLHHHQRGRRSEEHTSELQSRGHLVCRLLLEKKKKQHVQLLIIKTKNKKKESKIENKQK